MEYVNNSEQYTFSMTSSDNNIFDKCERNKLIFEKL